MFNVISPAGLRVGRLDRLFYLRIHLPDMLLSLGSTLNNSKHGALHTVQNMKQQDIYRHTLRVKVPYPSQ